jgi:hypothetical protein
MIEVDGNTYLVKTKAKPCPSKNLKIIRKFTTN